jgi:3-ketosteroid 9alpha-monooxygenase subunit B
VEKEETARQDARPVALRVARVVRETADACSIVLDIPTEVETLFRYQAGQFLTLRIPYEGKTLSRCYSLSSSPQWDAEHRITVKRVADGRISNWLNDHIKEGVVLECLPPGGLFVLGEGDADLALFAAGSGVTPVFSLLKTALVATARRVRLVYANRDTSSVIFSRELAEWEARYSGRLELIRSLDDRDGFVSVERVQEWSADRPDAEPYVCGPAPFMNTVERALLDMGVPEDRIHIERFVSPPDPGEGESSARDRVVVESDTVTVSVSLEGKGYDVEVGPGNTILGACQASGLRPPFSCTEGFCGCCMAKVLRGKVRMKTNDFLSKKEVEQGWVLTCQSVPITEDVEVRYPD